MTTCKIMHKDENHNIIDISKMAPLDIGRIIEGEFKEHIVFRTHEKDVHIVLNMTLFEPEACFIDEEDIKIELLPNAEIRIYC